MLVVRVVRNLHKIRFYLFVHSYPSYIFKTLCQDLHSSKLFERKLANILCFKKNSLHCFFFHKTCLRKFTVARLPKAEKQIIAAYLQIEEELCLLMQQRAKHDEVFGEDYEGPVLTLAIERAVGSALCEIEDDQEFEEKRALLEKQYNHWYYWIAWRYKLPTIRILPFLLRLMKG